MSKTTDPKSAASAIPPYTQNVKEKCTATPFESNKPFIHMLAMNDMHLTPTESNVPFFDTGEQDSGCTPYLSSKNL